MRYSRLEPFFDSRQEKDIWQDKQLVHKLFFGKEQLAGCNSDHSLLEICE